MSAHSCSWLACEPEIGLHATDDMVSLPAEIENLTAEAIADLTGSADLTGVQSAAAVVELLAELQWRRRQAQAVQTYLDMGKGRRLSAALAQLPQPRPRWDITKTTLAASDAAQ